MSLAPGLSSRRLRGELRALLSAALVLVAAPAGVRAAGVLIVGTDGIGPPRIQSLVDLDGDFQYETVVAEFVPFGPACKGARLASGDIDGDGRQELVVGCGPKGEARVGIFEIEADGSIGALRESWLPFGADFKGGVFPAVLDLDADQHAEVAVAQDRNGTGQVKIYSDLDGDGLLQTEETDTFQPFGSFRGGVRLAAIDLLGDGKQELVAGEGPGDESRVVVIGDTNSDHVLTGETPVDSFLPFDANARSGVYLAGGPLQVAGATVFVGAGAGEPTVRLFSDQNNDGTISDDPMFEEFAAYDKKLGGGVRVAAGDTDGSGFLVELVTVPGKGTTPTLEIFDDDVDAGSLIGDNPLADSHDVFDAKTKRGLFATVARTQAEVYASSANPRSIPDVAMLVSSIFVPPSAGVIRDLNVGLSIAHSFDGDLDVTLTHVPTGTTVALFSDVGGTNEGFAIRLDDEAGTDLSTATNPKLDGAISGNFNPAGAALLAAFDGEDASGEWRLSITDDSAGDTGALFGWELYVAY